MSHYRVRLLFVIVCTYRWWVWHSHNYRVFCVGEYPVKHPIPERYRNITLPGTPQYVLGYKLDDALLMYQHIVWYTYDTNSEVHVRSWIVTDSRLISNPRFIMYLSCKRYTVYTYNKHQLITGKIYVRVLLHTYVTCGWHAGSTHSTILYREVYIYIYTWFRAVNTFPIGSLTSILSFTQTPCTFPSRG
jgi:hypothetical protein